MTGLARIEARWEEALPAAPESWNAQVDVRLLVAVAKAARCTRSRLSGASCRELEELLEAEWCETCVALAGLDGAP